jgi:hypothetical protein
VRLVVSWGAYLLRTDYGGWQTLGSGYAGPKHRQGLSHVDFFPWQTRGVFCVVDALVMITAGLGQVK